MRNTLKPPYQAVFTNEETESQRTKGTCPKPRLEETNPKPDLGGCHGHHSLQELGSGHLEPVCVVVNKLVTYRSVINIWNIFPLVTKCPIDLNYFV